MMAADISFRLSEVEVAVEKFRREICNTITTVQVDYVLSRMMKDIDQKINKKIDR
jgi:hypothetical protein